METDLLTVTPETPLLDIHRMFVEEEIHGAPVVDDSGAVRGVVSTLDLLRAVQDVDEPAAGIAGYFRDQQPYAGSGSSERLPDLTAADVMTRELVFVTPETPVAEVAKTMRSQHVHRVLVIEEGMLVGVVTSFDLLKAFIDEPDRKSRAAS